MHVFIDTNILLNFFHYSNDELDALNDVFASHDHGSATVHLTEQVRDEFKRNREAKIKDALKKFTETRFAPQFPSFMKGYEEYGDIRKLSGELKELQKSILEKIAEDVSNHNLVADRLIGEIFETSEIVPVTKKLYEKASMRIALGNPPGKNRSLGDSINWIILMESVPNDEDIHIISEDGDFYSALNEQYAHPFLEEEWKRIKKGSLYCYRTLSAFIEEHFDGVAFSFDKNKEALIDELWKAGSFAATHALIGKLENYSYYSAKEVSRILDAAMENDQFGWIVSDYDVSDFLNRVAVPYLSSISSEDHKQMLRKVIEEQQERRDM
jgi:predicted nucleic acid-binding protein